MFLFFLALALIAGAVLLALNARERVEGLVLVDDATGAVVLEGWPILAEFSVIAGILATVVFLLALAIGFGASDLHIRLALRRRRDWLDGNYRDREHGIARDNWLRLEKELAATQRRLVAVRRQRAEYRRSLRKATRERDSAQRAIDAERSRTNGAARALRDGLRKSGANDGHPANRAIRHHRPRIAPVRRPAAIRRSRNATPRADPPGRKKGRRNSPPNAHKLARGRFTHISGLLIATRSRPLYGARRLLAFGRNRRRDLRPGHGVPRQAKQWGDGSARNYRFKHAAGNPAACVESTSYPG